MCKTVGRVLASAASLLLLTPASGAAQRAPNLSGDWVLVSATTSGARSNEPTGASPPGGQTPTSTTTVSGAVFNCGRECTIVHKGGTLTVDKALLGSNTAAAPAVVLPFNGRQISVVDSFSPNREIPATAKWTGNKLTITSSPGSHTVTQVLALEATRLVVVTSVGRPGAQPVTFTYKKK
jgi:hypothetical protein